MESQAVFKSSDFQGITGIGERVHGVIYELYKQEGSVTKLAIDNLIAKGKKISVSIPESNIDTAMLSPDGAIQFITSLLILEPCNKFLFAEWENNQHPLRASILAANKAIALELELAKVRQELV